MLVSAVAPRCYPFVNKPDDSVQQGGVLSAEVYP